MTPTPPQAGERAEAWIVVNVGCIECGVSTNVVGVFTEKTAANALAARLGKEMSWREGGQNSYEVFPMPALNQVAEEYATIAALDSEESK